MAAKLDLHFDPSGGKPIAEVGLISTHGSLLEHRPKLTMPCENFGEFAEEINLLREELNRMEAEAKEKFSAMAKIKH